MKLTGRGVVPMGIGSNINSSVVSAADTQPQAQVAIQFGTMGARG